MSRKMKDLEVVEALAELNNGLVEPWQIEDSKLVKLFEFADFIEAFGFMTRVALLVERHNHHPEWNNSWNRVGIALIIHDVRGLSMADFSLAAAIEKQA